MNRTRFSNPLVILVAFLPVLPLAGCKKADDQAATTPPPDSAMTVRDSFKTPESVLYDASADVYLVSNINGTPFEKDDNGFISKVGPDGHVITLRFIDGAADSVHLNAPKGMGIHGDTLFVADIDEVRMFDRSTGRQFGSLPVRGATFLNDVDVGPDGTMYVTDTGLLPGFAPSRTDAVYARGAGGQVRAIARSVDLDKPNGVLADSAGVTIVSWGGQVYRLDMQGHKTALTGIPHGSLDGVVRLADGMLLVSNWTDSSVVGLRSGAGETTFARIGSGYDGPADIGLDTKRNRLLIPVFNGNRIEIRPIAPASGHAQ